MKYIIIKESNDSFVGMLQEDGSFVKIAKAFFPTHATNLVAAANAEQRQYNPELLKLMDNAISAAWNDGGISESENDELHAFVNALRHS